MKYFIVLLLVLVAASSRAQITLEHTYNFSLIEYALVDSNEIMYFKLHSDTIDIYNANHSLYKSIIPNLGKGINIARIHYLSRHLFNSDNKLEMVIGTTPLNTACIIINEDGQVLFECTKCFLNYPLESGSDATPEGVVNTQFGAKLFIIDSLANTLVYSLPGKLPGCSTTTTSGVNAPTIISGNSLPLSAYPNPSNGQMRISYKLPLGESTGELVILTTGGVEVKRYRVGYGFNDILVEKSDLPSGSYFYKLVTDKGESEVQKLIILK
jgi:hypothetical protein